MDRHSGEIEKVLFGVAGLYSENLATHGISPKSVGWKDERSHLVRFEKLAQVIDLSRADRGFSVNDFGCGYGAMFQYLDTSFPGKLNRYWGYDISDEMLASAKERIRDSRAEFLRENIVLHSADYSFVSGTFNVKLEAAEEEWTNFVEECLMGLAAKSNDGLSFNLLSTYVDWKEDHLYYGDPLRFFDFCKRKLSRYVTLLHDYPLYEWTITVRKENGLK